MTRASRAGSRGEHMADSTIDKNTAKEDATKSPKAPKRGLGTPVWIIICVVALVAGVLCGHFLLGKGTASASGETTISDSELDNAIATYTYNGTSHDITAREVLEQNGSLENQANDDGTYNVPSADDVLSYARNAVVLEDANAQGISVTDDDVSQYAQNTLGTDDFATIGSNYGLDEDATKSLLHDAAVIKKLRDSVVTTRCPTSPPPLPRPLTATRTPRPPTTRSTSSTLPETRDSENNTWARTDGSYYSALDLLHL